MNKPLFWDYAIFSDEGFLSGISEDAPEDVKKSYEDYLREQEELKRKGIKI